MSEKYKIVELPTKEGGTEVKRFYEVPDNEIMGGFSPCDCCYFKNKTTEFCMVYLCCLSTKIHYRPVFAH